MKYEGTQLQNFEPRTEPVKELEIIDAVIGEGEEVQPGASITAHYTGALVNNGVIFQSSHDFGNAITFPLSGVIAGWTHGVPGMKVGGTRRLVIPAEMAYFISCGIALTTISRNLKTVIKMNKIEATSTAAKAVSQEICIPTHTLYAKKAPLPKVGANAIG